MKPKTKFTKMYYKLPEQARKELHIYYEGKPVSLSVCMNEVRQNTYMGKKILMQLGYTEE